jgi:hypothetical protein
MITFMRLVSVVIMFGSVVEAIADEPDGAPGKCLGQLRFPGRLPTGCPDDYCSKPLPRAKCLSRGESDDYCRKVMPRVWCLPCGEASDYCRKPWPILCRPLRMEHYNCGWGSE